MVTLKKCISLFAVLLLLAGLVTGCLNKSGATSPEEVTEDILAYVDTDINWVSLKKDKLSSYFGFSGDDLNSHSAYINDSEEKYDIVAAFEFKDHQALHAAVEKINVCLDAATKNFKSIIDTETEKIANRVILSNQNVLVVVVSSNADKIKEMLIEKGFSADI